MRVADSRAVIERANGLVDIALRDAMEFEAALIDDNAQAIGRCAIGIVDVDDKRHHLKGLFDLRRDGAPADEPVDARHLVDNGTWFVGDPDQVVDLIVEQYELSGGFGVLLQMGFDYADPEARDGWMRSMELLAQEVMPRVNAALGPRSA